MIRQRIKPSCFKIVFYSNFVWFPYSIFVHFQYEFLAAHILSILFFTFFFCVFIMSLMMSFGKAISPQSDHICYCCVKRALCDLGHDSQICTFCVLQIRSIIVAGMQNYTVVARTTTYTHILLKSKIFLWKKSVFLF